MSSVSPRLWLVLVSLVTVGTDAGFAADPASIVAVPQQGQSAERSRRDRYECHNWTIEQTGTAPLRAPDRDAVTAARRAARVERIVAGAGIGAVAGSVIGGAHDHRDAAEGAFVGSILGAVIGAATGRNKGRTADAGFDAYYRALSACLESRGYEVSIAD